METYFDRTNFEDIVEDDVTELEEAHESYGNSWRKRGGIGAYMMLARKWDRLENKAEEYARNDIEKWINLIDSDKEIEVHKNRIDKYTYSDTIQSYDLIEETAIISELCENRNIKFIVFDGNAYVKSILDKVVFNSSESLYNSIFYRPIIVDQLYHDKKVSLYESLIDDGIIIKPHGYFSWRESLENHSQLDREKIEGAYVGEKFDGFDFHPGYDAALLFSNFLYEMTNEL